MKIAENIGISRGSISVRDQFSIMGSMTAESGEVFSRRDNTTDKERPVA